MKNGFIKIHRQFLEWEWYEDNNTKVFFLHCLLKANWKRKSWRGENIERGSFITSISQLSNETGLSTRSVRTCIEHLMRTGELTSKPTSKWTKLSICNYDTYQELETQDDKQADKRDDKETTNERQSADKLPTTTKEGKERKKDKEREDNKKTSKKVFESAFDEFRKLYPGTKRGLETEFDHFTKKHSDWKEVVNDLKGIIECQINQRQVLANLPSTKFIPNWKNLSTWINNRCWEEVPAKRELTMADLNDGQKRLVRNDGLTIEEAAQYD